MMPGKTTSNLTGPSRIRAADLARLKKMLDDMTKQEQRRIDAGHVEVVPRSMRASEIKNAEALERVLKALGV